MQAPHADGSLPSSAGLTTKLRRQVLRAFNTSSEHLVCPDQPSTILDSVCWLAPLRIRPKGMGGIRWKPYSGCLLRHTQEGAEASMDIRPCAVEVLGKIAQIRAERQQRDKDCCSGSAHADACSCCHLMQKRQDFAILQDIIGPTPPPPPEPGARGL